jgi:endonuclease IV
MSIGLFISKNSHILENKHKSYIDAIKIETELLHISAFSLFLVGPLNKNKISMDYIGIKEYCNKNNIEIWPHASYISAGIWSITKENRHTNKSLMWMRHLRDQLIAGKQLGAKGISFHLPRHPIETVIEVMEILSDCKVINSIRNNEGTLPLFLFEMPASKPNDTLTYETSEKLNALVKALLKNKKITLSWGLNPDTCHEFAGGVNFGIEWDKWESNLSNETRNRIKLIHLNGAKGINFGTGKDGHIIPMSPTDAIWGNLVSDEYRDFLNRTDIADINKINLYEKLTADELKIIKNSSLNSIVQWCKIHNIAMIMEINDKQYKNTKFAMDVINGLLSKKGGFELQLDNLLHILKI